MQYFEERDGKLIFRYNGETVQVEAWGQDSLRVRSRVLGEISEECSALTEEVAGRQAWCWYRRYRREPCRWYEVPWCL